MKTRTIVLLLLAVLGLAAMAIVPAWAGRHAPGQMLAAADQPGAPATAAGNTPPVKTVDADDEEEEEEEEDDGDDESGQDNVQEDKKEVKVALDQLPAAVKQAIQKEAGDNAIKEIEAKTKDGKTVYEAEWIAGGQEVEIKVSADGQILRKKVEDADDDDDDDDDDEDTDDDDQDGGGNHQHQH